MGETLKSSKDLRIRNVSLHSRGKKLDGSLFLTRHHLIFSYIPNGTPSGERISSTIPRALHGNGVAETSREAASLDSNTHRDSNDSTTRQSIPKARPKEIYVPYPLINHCVLRPSYSQGFRVYDHEAHHQDDAGDDADSAFPPVYGTSSYTRPSTDSAHLSAHASPQRAVSPGPGSVAHVSDSGRVPALRIRRRDFQMIAFHFHHSTSERSSDDLAREVFYCLRSRCCVDDVQSMHAFHFDPPQQERAVGGILYEARREFSRMGIGGKSAEGPGSAWRLSDINCDYAYSPTYPNILCVPRSVSDNMLKYGGAFRSKARIPALTYLHSNGGSITRSSQPLVGIQSKRNPQDERLVAAIFSSHATLQQPSDEASSGPSVGDGSLPTAAERLSLGPDTGVPGLSISHSDTAHDDPEQESLPHKKIYGSTRRNIIVDARPKVNALANRATGGGIEDVSNYCGLSGTTVERIFLNIANIHAMRKSLEKVIESFANSDYLDMRPNQELLRNSGWLAHIANLLDGSEMVARVVGLGGSHVLVHCSDGWDRTSQVAALAQIMLDPHYRTLQGFITLVQKDFISFGHKFNHRHGIQGSEKWFEIENERVAPSRTKDTGNADTTGLNKALSGAKNWFEKNRNTLFRQQNDSKGSLDEPDSRPPSPPPNPVLHSTPTTNTKEDREHKTDTKEIAPIFHQFLDAVFQLQQHYPEAFEFNERFLRRLFYQAHSGQYGEFLFNNEKGRGEHEGKFSPVWPHFLSRKQEFINSEYAAKVEDQLLFPKRHPLAENVEVRWWSALFGRKDEEMNNARTLAPPDHGSSFETSRLSAEHQGGPTGHTEPYESANTIREARSLPSLGPVEQGLLQNPSPAHEESMGPSRPKLEHRETDADVLARYAQGVNSDDDRKSSTVAEAPSRLDFAAFAKQSAFSDR